METKPYSLQSPEQIAKDYGGNKQKIAEAMQMGIIDPTAGTLAGMFIDRMRSAQQQEMAPQPTIAQQVFAPPAPPAPPQMPAGLGATPQAAMGAPMGAPAAPPAPPAPPMGAMPPQQAPMGMAEGGYLPPYASGGLTDLPIPDGMFDEPDNGGYAAGGIVAFATGNEVDGGEMTVTAPPPPPPPPPTEEEERRGKVIARETTPDYTVPGALYGYRSTLRGNLGNLNDVAPYRTEAAQEFADYLRGQLDPAERERARERDMWTVLGQLGARMASTPGSLLQAIGAGIGEAVPAAASSARERRAAERELRQALVGEERTGNREVNERAAIALDMLSKYGSFAEAMKDRAFKDYWESMGRAAQLEAARMGAAASMFGSSVAAGASRYATEMGYRSNQEQTAAARDTAKLNSLTAYLGTPAGTMAMQQAQAAGRGDEFMAGLMRQFGITTAPSTTPGAGLQSFNPILQDLIGSFTSGGRSLGAAPPSGAPAPAVRTYNPATGRLE